MEVEGSLCSLVDFFLVGIIHIYTACVTTAALRDSPAIVEPEILPVVGFPQVRTSFLPLPLPSLQVMNVFPFFFGISRVVQILGA